MKKIYLLIAISFMGIFFSIDTSSQDQEKNKTWRLGIYSGITPYVDTDLNHFSFIRKSVDSYYNDYDYVNGTFYTWKLGVKFEKGILNEKIAFFTGVHYSNLQSTMESSDYGSSEFMLINISQDNQNLNFIRTTSFEHSLHYIGTQIGLRQKLYDGFLAELYISGNIDVNLLLGNQMDINFYNSAMSSYSNQVKSLFNSPSKLFSTVNCTAGLKFGKPSQSNLLLEMGPSFLLTNNNSSLTKASVGLNMQICYYLPLK